MRTLADLVAFRTVGEKGANVRDNAEFQGLTAYLERKSRDLGFDFSDHGAVVLIGLGESSERLGIVTHADVQPADPARWATDPFHLDMESEPGHLVGRGAEDDKGPLAAILYAMRALVDREVSLTRRIELIVSYTEESDWEPFKRFLANWDPPQLNVAVDAAYPVATAEKGWGTIELVIPARELQRSAGPSLRSFSGGSFLSQVPEAAEAVVLGVTPDFEARLRERARADQSAIFEFERQGTELRIRAEGVSAHSSAPWNGVNALSHLATVLASVDWSESPSASMVRLVDDLVGTGNYAERFGDLAHNHPFMGPLTLTLATMESREDGSVVAGISLRRPIGRTREQIEHAVRVAVARWAQQSETQDLELTLEIGEPYYLENAPHVPVLLDIFRHYSGIEQTAPIAIGGGTNARLLPYGVSFGPQMPGAVYTGHTEHEFISREQLLLNLEMYTAMLVELAGEGGMAPLNSQALGSVFCLGIQD